METLTNAATAASRAIFGDNTTSPTESGKEPTSGQVGDTSKGEPYDAGNTGCKCCYNIILFKASTNFVDRVQPDFPDTEAYMPSTSLC